MEVCRPEVICQVGQCVLCLQATPSTPCTYGESRRNAFSVRLSLKNTSKEECVPSAPCHLVPAHPQTSSLSSFKHCPRPDWKCISCLIVSESYLNPWLSQQTRCPLLPACSSEPAEHAIKTSAFGIQSTELLLCSVQVEMSPPPPPRFK